MYHSKRITLLCICILCLVSGLINGCKLFDREEAAPAYISFRNPLVLVDSTPPILNVPAGAKDVWLYDTTGFLGVFPFPSTVPLSYFNNTNYLIEGGIFESGLSAFRLPYPFWKPIKFQVNTDALDTVVITPQFEYYNDSFITFSYLEDFENLFFQFTPIITTDSSKLARASSGDSFEGQHHGIAYFDSTHKLLSIISSALPPVAKNVNIYAEITFRSDFELIAGMYYLSPQVRQIPLVYLVPKTEWTTVYVHLTNTIATAPDDSGIEFKLWLYANGGGGTGTVEIDHIRVVHFKQ